MTANSLSPNVSIAYVDMFVKVESQHAIRDYSPDSSAANSGPASIVNLEKAEPEVLPPITHRPIGVTLYIHDAFVQPIFAKFSRQNVSTFAGSSTIILVCRCNICERKAMV
jgi:hypothetical protein